MTEALYTEQWLLLAEISSQGGISCSHWLIWVLVEEPLACIYHTSFILASSAFEQTSSPNIQ